MLVVDNLFLLLSMWVEYQITSQKFVRLAISTIYVFIGILSVLLCAKGVFVLFYFHKNVRTIFVLALNFFSSTTLVVYEEIITKLRSTQI